MNGEVVLVSVAVLAALASLTVLARGSQPRVRRWPVLVPVTKPVWIMWLVAAAVVFGWFLFGTH